MVYLACTGTPVAGTLTTTDTALCATGAASLYFSSDYFTPDITFTWQSSPDGAAWTDIAGATAGYYPVSGLTAPVYYRRLLTCTATGLSSATDTVRIDTLPVCPCAAGLTIGAATHSGPDTIAAGTPFTLTASGATASAGYAYVWQALSGSVWHNIPGATDTTYTCSGISATTAYRCVVGCSYSRLAYSSVTTVYLAPPLCTGTPGAGTASSSIGIACDTSAFSVSTTGYASGAGITLQWASSPDSATWSPISGATDAIYNGAGLAANTYFRCTATCISSGLSSHTHGVRVAYSAACPCTGAPGAGGIIVSATAGACAAVTLTDTGAAAAAPGISYQWQSSATSASSGFTAIAGATGASYTFTDPHTTLYLQYAVGCSYSGHWSATSFAVDTNQIYGHITYSAGTPAYLDTKVWLIYHDFAAGTLTAVDSQIACIDGGIPFYSFSNQPAGEYRVKAKLLMDTIPGVSAYIPTYGYSSPYWDTATLITHTAADSLQVNMVYGSVPAGPGFIGGSIAMGAGRHTSGDVPAAGMLVYLRSNATNAILTWQVTDATGAYAFSGLGYGAYNIYPAALGYATTPSAPITLSAAAPGSTGLNFKEHATAQTITPELGATAVPVVSAQVVSIYPNPAAGSFNILWVAQPISKADVSVTDITGREVYKTIMDINIPSGSTAINIASLQSGIYFISIKSAAINFSSKLLIQK